MKKVLVLGIIALFIGLAFIPSFNAVSISQDIGESNSVIVVHVTELYGTIDNPQYRNLPNVTVKIKEVPLWWKTYWSGKTHENGTTEQVKVELGFLYKVIVSKQGYIVYNDDNYAVIGPYEIKEYHVYFTMVKKKVKDIENDCLDCQSNGKTHLAEKLINRLEKNEVISKVIKSNNLWDDDRPICILLNNTIQRLLDYADSLFYLMDTLPEDSILGEIISMIAYMIGWIGVGYVAAIAIKLNCWEITF